MSSECEKRLFLAIAEKSYDANWQRATDYDISLTCGFRIKFPKQQIAQRCISNNNDRNNNYFTKTITLTIVGKINRRKQYLNSSRKLVVICLLLFLSAIKASKQPQWQPQSPLHEQPQTHRVKKQNARAVAPWDMLVNANKNKNKTTMLVLLLSARIFTHVGGKQKGKYKGNKLLAEIIWHLPTSSTS